MRLSLRFGLITVLVITVLMLMTSLAGATVYTWEDEAGVVTFSDSPSSAPEGIQAKVFLNESPRQKVSEAREAEEAPRQPSPVPPSVVTQGEFAVHLARELGYSEGRTPEAATRILSDIPIIPPFGGWDLNAAMTPEITSRLRAMTIAAPQRGWISVTPEEARHAFDTSAALLGLSIPVDRDSALLEPLAPAQALPLPGDITQGEFAVRLAHELGLGQDLTDEAATRILSDLRIAPPLGKWERNAAMTPELTSRLRTLTVAASQMEWISATPEEALFAFDSAAALSGVSIPIDLDAGEKPDAPRTVVAPPLVYISPPPYIIAPYYTWVAFPGGFLWHGSTVRGFFALHSAHINIHFFNGHRFGFKPHFVRHHFLDHLRGHHLKRRHVIRHPVDRTVVPFTTPFIRPFPPLHHRQKDLRRSRQFRPPHRGGFRDREHIIRHRIGRGRPLERHFVNKNIIRRSTLHLFRRVPPYGQPKPHIRNHQRGLRNSLHLRGSLRGGLHDRKDALRQKTGWKKYRARHLPPASQNLAKRRIIPSAPHALRMPPQQTRPSAFPKIQGKRGRHWSASVRPRRR